MNNDDSVLKKIFLMIYENEFSNEERRAFWKNANYDLIVHIVQGKRLFQLKEEYPDLFAQAEHKLYTVNILSTKMLTNKGYKKIRYYFNENANLLARLEN